MKYNLATFKKGPDYIDPLWISKASKTSCYNLDFNTMSTAEIKKLFKSKTQNTALNLIEGNKGLFDGVSLDGSDSNAAMAHLLKLEIILVIDCSGITRGIAPLINGYKDFDPKIKYKGIILNNIASDRHEGKIINAIAEYSDFKVFGSIQKNNKIEILEQHLGLQPSFLTSSNNNIINNIASLVKSSVDIKHLVKGVSNKKKLSTKTPNVITKKYAGISIGVARDNAFGFYYADDIEKFKSLGARIIYFNTLKDKSLPNVDALFIGGGFPELVAKELSSNKKMISSIKNFINANKPVYAECGGLMYLAKSIKINDKSFRMVGIINGRVVMHDKPVGRGHVELIKSSSHPWLLSNDSIKAHEFHYSRLSLDAKLSNYAYKVKRGYGVNGKYDGIKYKNLLATYSHLRDTKKTTWITNFLEFIKNNKKNETKNNI
jgi:cobyrinic acid a,c-diamide synthase